MSRVYKNDEDSERLWDLFYGAVAVGTPIYAYRKIKELSDLEMKYREIQRSGDRRYKSFLNNYNPQQLLFDKVMSGIVGVSGPLTAFVNKK